MEPQETSRLEELNKHLYEQGSKLRGDVRSRLSKSPEHPRAGWNDAEVLESNALTSQQHSTSLAQKILMMSLVFFVGALGVAAYYFLSGSNVFSNSNIDIAVTGPVATEGGKELGLQIVLTNRNPVSLMSADFVVEYPEGTRAVGGSGQEVRSTQEYIGEIKPGQTVSKTANVILYGEENSQRTIKFSLQYSTPNSTAIYERTKEYAVVLSSSPIGIVVDLPKEVTTNKEIEIGIRVAPNASVPVKDVLLAVQYPKGFTFRDSEPVPAAKTNVWRLGDLTPGQERLLKIRGVLEGQDNDIKSFKFSAGLKKADDDTAIGTMYTTTYKTITIVRPSITVATTLNDSDAADIVTLPGQGIKTVIDWTNNLAEKLADVKVNVKLYGVTIDKESVKAEGSGLYQSADNTLVWDSTSGDVYSSVEPGEKVANTFSLSSLAPNNAAYTSGKNPVITMDITVSGTRLLPGTQAERVESKVTRTIKLASDVAVGSRAVYSVGPFTNSGPVPPRVETPTTYTLVWSVRNGASDLYGVTVRGYLPPGVTWLSASQPSSENMSYDSNSRIVTWNVGDVRSGVGSVTEGREVSFQVRLVPSVTDLGIDAVLVKDVILGGTDSFARTQVSSRAADTSASLDTDPKHVYNDGKVSR